MLLDDLKAFARANNLDAIASHETHWQVIRPDGKPIIDFWPTSYKWRMANARKGVKAKMLKSDGELYQAIEIAGDTRNENAACPPMDHGAAIRDLVRRVVNLEQRIEHLVQKQCDYAGVPY